MVTVEPVKLPAGDGPPPSSSQIIISRPVLLLVVVWFGLYQMSYASSHLPPLTVVVWSVVVTLSPAMADTWTGSGSLAVHVEGGQVAAVECPWLVAEGARRE